MFDNDLEYLNEETLNEDEFQEQEVHIEVIDFYNENEECLVEKALNEIGFAFMAEKFKEEKIDYECYLNLNSFHIHQLFKEFKLGLSVKFEAKYHKWMADQQGVLSQSSSLRVNETKTLISKGIVKAILCSTSNGKEFWDKFDRNSKLLRPAESELCDFICAHFFSKQECISSKELQLIADDIEDTYPNELSSVYYSKIDKKQSGILYDKYNNKLKMLRECHLMPCSSRKRKADDSNAESNVEQPFTQDEVSSNDFVKYTTANVDFSLLVDHWRRSSRLRIHSYKTMIENNFSTIYRALLRPDGHELISIDFESIYPGRNFKTNWIATQQKTIDILMRVITQDALTSKFSRLHEVSFNQALAIILLALHHVLSGDKVSYDDKKKIYRPTVYDSFCFLLLLVNDENTMDIEVNNWTQKNVQKQLKQQAIIVGFGGSIDNLKDKFCLVLEDMKYVFEGENALLYALERLLQMYHVFNIEYPILNSSVHIFLSSKFLGINGMSKKGVRSKITRLLNEYN